MPPIPVHIDDPIIASKPEGVTPHTAAPQERSRTTAVNPGVTTAAATQPFPAAQPGAAAVPAPTPIAPPPLSAYAPLAQTQPTRTVQLSDDVPPPPQPGAAPVPPSAQPATATATATSTLPPPPTTFHPAPSNLSQNLAPTHSTTTAAPSTPSRTGQGPTTLNLGPVTSTPISTGPPGYRQDAYAQELSPAQRASLDVSQAERKQRSVFAGLAGDVGDGGGQVANAWTAVKGWVGAAGSKAAEVEGEVWKRVNGAGK